MAPECPVQCLKTLLRQTDTDAKSGGGGWLGRLLQNMKMAALEIALALNTATGHQFVWH